MVVSLAAFVIAGPVSATMTEAGDDQEMVLTDEDKPDVLDGLLYVVTASLLGDLFGSDHTSHSFASSPPPEQTELGGGEGLYLGSTKVDPQVRQFASAAPEPTAALLMAMGLTVTGMRLRGRKSR